MANSRVQGNQYRTTLVCVDSYHDGIPQGRFFNPACPQGTVFRSLLQFFAAMDQLLNQLKLPQAFTLMRSFAPAAPARELPARQEICPQGQLATFSLRVLFRQNASWQGEICWLDGSQAQPFRSALELAFLLDSALGGGPAAAAGTEEIISP